MESPQPIACRIAACSEPHEGVKQWSFYLINDSKAPLEWALLHEVGYEWGDWGDSKAADMRITDLAPGAHALIWRDNGDGAELNMDLSLQVRTLGAEMKLRFEFPKLYRMRNLPPVDGLGKPGWQVAAAIRRE